jgi:ABC-type nitrate/sulfonate/bicarbonate transport system substrate-binding protein
MQNFVLLLFFFFVSLALHSPVSAFDRHLHASAGATSAQQLPIFVAKDLGIFEKQGLDVDLC